MLTGLTPEELSSDLREGASPFLNNRRWVVGLSLLSAGIMGGIGLYQMGILKKVPEPSWKNFNSGKVNSSAEAYSHAATPDALLALVSYAITACLAGAGSQNRALTHRWLPIGMAGKTAVDALAAATLTASEWRNYKTLCFWCLVAAGATFGSLAFALPEAAAAFRPKR